jgi:hypothetical protein
LLISLESAQIVAPSNARFRRGAAMTDDGTASIDHQRIAALYLGHWPAEAIGGCCDRARNLS